MDTIIWSLQTYGIYACLVLGGLLIGVGWGLGYGHHAVVTRMAMRRAASMQMQGRPGDHLSVVLVDHGAPPDDPRRMAGTPSGRQK